MGAVTDDEILEQQVPERYGWAVVADTLNVREAPTVNSEIRGELQRGERVAVNEKHNYGVWKLVCNEKVSGWVHGAYLNLLV